eukprot:EG_transcript_1257
MMQDARYRYVANRVVDFVVQEDPKFGLPQVDQCCEAPGCMELLGRFFNGQGHPCLWFYFEPVLNDGPCQLSLHGGLSGPPTRRLIYCLRTSPAHAPVASKEPELLNDLALGTVEVKGPAHFEHLLSKLYVPTLNSAVGWGKCQVQDRMDYMAGMHKYLETLSDLLEAQPNVLVLPKPDPGWVDGIVAAAGNRFLEGSMVSKAGNDHSLLVKLEDLVEKWMHLIDTLLAEQEECATMEPQNIPESIGPLTELDYWRTRFHKLEGLQDWLGEPPQRAVISVLRSAHSRLTLRWQTMENDIMEATHEAKDNVKYLTTLEKFFEPLYYSRPDAIIEVLPSFMNNVKVMYTIARHYGTPERMTTLFIKVTNQMIVNCKGAIRREGRLWEQAFELGLLQELLKNLHLCLRLNAAYHEEYSKAKESLERTAGVGPAKLFSFNELHIFGKFELFCKRVQKLIDVFTTVDQFTSLTGHNVDGMDPLLQRFAEIVDELKRKTSDLLDYTKPAFDKDYIEFNRSVQELESSLQVFINSSFENISSTVYALGLLKKFQCILKRDTLRADLESKYMVIFHNYGLDLENVQKLYERQKTAPPALRCWPPVASNIMWARQLLRRIEEPMEKFQQYSTITANPKEARKVIRAYNKVARCLVEYEAVWLQAWRGGVAAAKAGLQATLLVRVDGRLFVNFDVEAFQLIREAKCLLRIGLPLPENARLVLLQADKLKGFYSQLDYALAERERVVGLIPPVMQPLMCCCVAALDRLAVPGETVLTWLSLNIEAYISRLLVGVQRLEETVRSVNGIVEHRVQHNLRLIAKALLVHLPDNESFSLEQFVRLQEQHIAEQSEFINVKDAEIEKASEDVVQCVVAAQASDEGLTEPIPAAEITKLKVHFNRLLFKALLTTTIQSLNLIKRRVSTRSLQGFMAVDKPFFDVAVELHPPHVLLNPSLEEVQAAINKCATTILRCSKGIEQWPDLAEISFFAQIARHKEIVKVVLLLTGGMHGLHKQVLDYLNSFGRYEYLWLQDKEEAYQRFLAGEPTLEDFEAELQKYLQVEQEVGNLAGSYTIGPLCLQTAPLKAALRREAAEWKAQYARNLHHTARTDLDTLLFEMAESAKLQAAPITGNLGDLRVLMGAL